MAREVEGIGGEPGEGDDEGEAGVVLGGVMGNIVGYFVAEDSGEAVGAGADGEETAEDEDLTTEEVRLGLCLGEWGG